jgi:hypothetical protein
LSRVCVALEPPLPDNAVMAKHKGKQEAEPDRHKPSRMVRVKESVARQVDVLVKRSDTNFAQEVHRLLLEALERRSLWPPPPRQP